MSWGKDKLLLYLGIIVERTKTHGYGSGSLAAQIEHGTTHIGNIATIDKLLRRGHIRVDSAGRAIATRKGIKWYRKHATRRIERFVEEARLKTED